jgi:hypothetical protein
MPSKDACAVRPAALRRPLNAALLAFGLAGLPASAAWAFDGAPLKAAIVYNLLSFVDWPKDDALSQGPDMVLCVDAASALLAPLRQLEGKPVRQQRLVVKEVRPGALAAGCRALYIDDLRLADLQRGFRGQPLLTVCDEGVPVEAAIRLVWVDNRIAFDLDLPVARQSRLQISTRLMRLARKVAQP